MSDNDQKSKEPKSPPSSRQGFTPENVRTGLMAEIKKPPHDPEIIERGKSYVIIKAKI